MAGNYKVIVEGDDTLAFELDRRAVEVPAKMRKLLAELGMYTEFAAKGFAPHRTANLAKNIVFEGVQESEPGHYVGVVGVRKTAPYGRFVEKGTGLFSDHPHFIFPKQGNFMVWEERGAFATPYQGTHVSNHPLVSKTAAFLIVARRTKGQPGQHYMAKAFEDMKNTYLPQRLHALADHI